MGVALARALLLHGQATAKDLIIAERDPQSRSALAHELGCLCVESLSEQNCSSEDVLFLAVKPHDLKTASETVTRVVAQKPLIISTIAGVSLQSLSNLFSGHARVVRSMPNLPLQIGQGVTAFTCGSAVSQSDRELVAQIFESCGTALEVSNDEMIDAATAVSGSGPAYIYYLVEQLERAAQGLGFSAIQSQTLVSETFAGALALMKERSESAADLRRRVTSPNGTTAAAIATLDSHKVPEILEKTVLAAFNRARELSK